MRHPSSPGYSTTVSGFSWTAVLRADARARWREWLSIVLLVGLAGAAVLTTAAGARRTDTAYARFLRSSVAADAYMAVRQHDVDRGEVADDWKQVHRVGVLVPRSRERARAAVHDQRDATLG